MLPPTAAKHIELAKQDTAQYLLKLLLLNIVIFQALGGLEMSHCHVLLLGSFLGILDTLFWINNLR